MDDFEEPIGGEDNGCLIVIIMIIVAGVTIITLL